MSKRLFLTAAIGLGLLIGPMPSAQAAASCYATTFTPTTSCSLALGGTSIYFSGYAYWNTPVLGTVTVTVSLGAVELGRCDAVSIYGASCGQAVLRIPAGAVLPHAATLTCTVTGPAITIRSDVSCTTGSF